MIITLNGERPKSWNEFWSGLHWASRSQWNNRVKLLIQSELPEMPPVSYPVSVTIRVFFDKRPLDASNICNKPYIDALIGRVVADDTPKWMPSVTAESHIDRKNPRVEIEIEKWILKNTA